MNMYLLSRLLKQSQTVDEAHLGHLHLEHLVPHHEEGGSEAGGEEDAEVHGQAEPVLDLERQVLKEQKEKHFSVEI